MKKYFFYAVSALALAGCSSDDFLGGQPSPTKLTDNNVINFSGASSATTRGVLNGTTNPTAASKLGENFVVYGYKTLPGTAATPKVVYDHYNVNWAGTANHTESNTAGWEYVGYTPNVLTTLPSGSTQTIKYWDYSASQYDFVAFSFGDATQVTADPENDNEVKASQVTTTDGPKYTLTGKVENLAKVYIADRVTAKKGATPKANLLVAYGSPVQFNFRSLGTKVRIGLYETIPGYSVKDVKFYTSNIASSSTVDPCLYSTATEARIPNGSGTMTVTFGPNNDANNTDYNKAHVSWLAADGSANSSILSLTKYPVRGNSGNEIHGNNYLYDNSTDARGTSVGDDPTNPYITVLPARVGNLKLKVDYTLVSIDGSGETINVTGATAVVPEVYTNWEPNYAYTYIFKISDKTNGSTDGTGDSAGLYPITFDAIVTVEQDGLPGLETITTVTDPSITTYSKNAGNNEYKKDSNVYVSVVKEGSAVTLSLTDPNTNCALYTAESNGYNGGITESTVANCLVPAAENPAGTWTVTDAQGKTLTVKKASGLSIVDEIAAEDAPDGNKINGKFAKFHPTAAGTYVFQYIEGGNKYYKVIKVQ